MVLDFTSWYGSACFPGRILSGNNETGSFEQSNDPIFLRRAQLCTAAGIVAGRNMPVLTTIYGPTLRPAAFLFLTGFDGDLHIFGVAK